MDKHSVLIPREVAIYVFKSIHGETRIPLHPGLQFLIGTNGAGKSTLLQAISLIGEGYEIPQNWPPKFLTADKRKKLIEKADETVVSEFFFDAVPELFGKAAYEEVKAISTMALKLFASGRSVFVSNVGELPSKNARFSKRYDDAEKGLRSLLAEISRGEYGNNTSLMSAASKTMSEKDGRQIIDPKQLTALSAVCKQVAPSIFEKVEAAANEFNAAKELYFNPPDWVAALDGLLPRITLIPPRYELPDQFTLEAVENATEGSLLSAKKLLALGGITGAAVASLDENEVQQAMHQASEILTKLINKHWKQESLELKISRGQEDKLILTLRESTGAFVAPSECSEGLKWYLPFFVNLAVDLGEEWRNGIVLIDDPGVYLHPEAQKDVRELLKKLAKDNAVLVTTHSPFILDAIDTSNIHVVQKAKGGKGKVGTYVLSPKESGWEDKAVIRAAIGMTIGDTFFGNEITLIVEGHSDRLYLEAILRLRDMEKRLGVKVEEVGVLNAMGADKIEFYANWCFSENRAFCVVLDNDSKGRGRLERLKAMGLGEHAIILAKEFLRDDSTGDATIEDLLSTQEWDAIMARSAIVRGKEGSKILTALQEEAVTLMNVTRAEKAFAKIMGKKYTVDKIMASDIFSGVVDLPAYKDDQLEISEGTIDRFRDLIKAAIDRTR